METRSVKERIIETLRVSACTKDELLAQFTYESQRRGAASVLAFMVRSGQVEVDSGDKYRLTGRSAQPVTRKRQPQTVPEAEAPASPGLEWALWSDGDLLIRRGDASIVLTTEERSSILIWLERVAA